jgi:hypothetical protein
MERHAGRQQLERDSRTIRFLNTHTRAQHTKALGRSSQEASLKVRTRGSVDMAVCPQQLHQKDWARVLRVKSCLGRIFCTNKEGVYKRRSGLLISVSVLLAMGVMSGAVRVIRKRAYTSFRYGHNTLRKASATYNMCYGPTSKWYSNLEGKSSRGDPLRCLRFSVKRYLGTEIPTHTHIHTPMTARNTIGSIKLSVCVYRVYGNDAWSLAISMALPIQDYTVLTTELSGTTSPSPILARCLSYRWKLENMQTLFLSYIEYCCYVPYCVGCATGNKSQTTHHMHPHSYVRLYL